MPTFQDKFDEYAQLLIRFGVNLQPGQTLALRADVDCAPLARLCVKYAYEAGARDVVVDWRDDTLTRERYLHAEDTVFDEVDPWIKPKFDHLATIQAPRLAIIGSDPEALAGVDSQRIIRAQRASDPATKAYFDAQMAGQFQWCIGAYATPVWATKVFPHLPREEAVEKLWESIFSAVRVKGDGSAVEAWRQHIETQKRVIDILNGYQFISLHYTNSLGTDLTVGLPQGHFWAGGSERSNGAVQVEFAPNMPTEEIFTLPHRDRVNGRVYAALPLALNGNLIEGFWLEFKDGKITDLHADQGEQYLRDAISIDEGALHLGEVALVPFHSPIRDTGILFYETLFDENAACHLAFGEAYPCLEGAEGKSKEELIAMGVNQSMTHVDFMVGTADLSITGTTPDGRKIPVFREGNFAF